jgi:hypothetical protein
VLENDEKGEKRFELENACVERGFFSENNVDIRMKLFIYVLSTRLCLVFAFFI